MNKPSTFAKRLRELLDYTGWTQTKLAAETGISKSSINHYLKGDWEGKQDAVFAIARAANVSEAWLMGFDVCRDRFDLDYVSVITCPNCGFRYNQNDAEEKTNHLKRHKKWENAVKLFGFCWPVAHREREKADARNRISAGGLTTSEHVHAQITVFKALFSRSLENADYSTAHVDFATYVAMMLNQDQWKRKIDPHIYNLLVEDYGTKPGIQEGTYYAVPSLPDAAQAIDLASELRIPILGRISAGLPLYAEEHIEGYTLTDLNGGAEYFALKVKGDSMDAIGIKEGYTIIVRRQEEVENGEVAVVMVGDDDATVKRFYSSGVAVTLMPQSTNPIHAPQNYDLSNTGVKVLGKVVEVKFSL